MFDKVAYRKTYYQDNMDRLKAEALAYYHSNSVHRKGLNKIWRNSFAGYLYIKLRMTKSRAKKIGVVYNLTFYQLNNLYNKQQGLCALTGRRLCVKRKQSLDSLSIDRKNQRKGYTIHNIRLVTWQANTARHTGTDTQLVAFCRDVLKYARRSK